MQTMAIEQFLMVYIFPFQLTIGLIGNIFNLVVLLSKGMRSKTNSALATMAFADILFLVFMLPHSLIVNEHFSQLPGFRSFIVRFHQHITGIANMCSFSSAWLIVMISMERTTAVIWPLRSRNFWTAKMLFALVVIIWISGGLVSMHWHITHQIIDGVKIMSIRNESTGAVMEVKRPTIQFELRRGMESYRQIAVFVEMVMLVFVPVVLVLASNALMILGLRRQNREDDVHIKRQRRATIIVFIIATTFTICQTPSAVLHLVELVWPDISKNNKFRTVATFTNSLVIMGKTANFFLFCTWSSYFRKNLKRVIAKKMPCCYQIVERGANRFNSNSTMLSSRTRLIAKLQVHRLQSQPTATHPAEQQMQTLRINRSFPTNGHLERKKSSVTSQLMPLIENDNPHHDKPRFSLTEQYEATTDL